MAIASQLLNTSLNPATLGGAAVEQARALVAGASEQANSGTRMEYLNQKAAANPALAHLALLLK